MCLGIPGKVIKTFPVGSGVDAHVVDVGFLDARPAELEAQPPDQVERAVARAGRPEQAGRHGRSRAVDCRIASVSADGGQVIVASSVSRIFSIVKR